MKCPNCGAETREPICEYCGSEVQQESKRAKCSKCGSTDIAFKRENQGEVRGKKSKQIVHRTVGYCKDCGNTWYVAEDAPKKRKTWLWVLGWICIFPLPLTILLLRNKKMKSVIKYTIIAVAWLIYLLIGLSGQSTNKDSSLPETTEAPVTQVEESVQESKHIYADAEIVDLMNGFGTEKIGTISVVKASQAECTDEALTDWYFNFVKDNADCNYHIIAYTDVAGKGAYANKGFIQKDISLIEESSGTYMLGDDAGSTYYTVNEDEKTITARMVMADEEVVNNAKTKIDKVVPEDYKSGKMYSIDVAGEEGSLDCNLTLISEAFGAADCQNVAVELASKIKELDLGIGYFCIAFQSDDYTMKALSSLDNLATQEPSEITTQTY